MAIFGKNNVVRVSQANAGRNDALLENQALNLGRIVGKSGGWGTDEPFAIIVGSTENVIDFDLNGVRPRRNLGVGDAIAEFVRLMSRSLESLGLASNPQRWPIVSENYRKSVADYGWPKMSDKALSQALVEHGCVRIGPNDGGYPRKRHPSRTVLFVFPETEALPQ